MLFDMATGPVQTVLLMAGKSSWNLLSMAAALAVNVVLNLLLIPPLGIEGAAIAWVVTIVVQNAIPLVQLWLVLGLHPFSRSLVAAALGSLGCFGLPALVATELLGQTVPALLLFVPLALAAYGAFLFRFRSALALDAVRQALPPLPRPRRRAAARYASPGAVG
jgi:O-antigen/teichoic acid export membrane protein